eukprot:scaffold7969_cov56-Attheya_sp.AAC.3
MTHQEQQKYPLPRSAILPNISFSEAASCTEYHLQPLAHAEVGNYHSSSKDWNRDCEYEIPL